VGQKYLGPKNPEGRRKPAIGPENSTGAKAALARCHIKVSWFFGFLGFKTPARALAPADRLNQQSTSPMSPVGHERVGITRLPASIATRGAGVRQGCIGLQQRPDGRHGCDGSVREELAEGKSLPKTGGYCDPPTQPVITLTTVGSSETG
jgi:hypothetical protein